MPDPADGPWPGQRIVVLPRAVLDGSLRHPLLGDLCVSDAGWFPQARGHHRDRGGGLPQAVLLLCVSGSGWIESGGCRHALASGMLAFLPPGRGHAYGSDGEEPWSIWWLHLAGRQVQVWASLMPGVAFRPDDPGLAAARIEEILGILEHDDGVRAQIAASGAAAHLLGSIIAGGGPPDDPVAVARDWLRERCHTEVAMGDLARAVGVSPSWLRARFRAETGLPPKRYQLRLRLARAREMLANTALPIVEIASRLGFADPAFFSRVFRRVHGIGPREWRRESKG